MGGGEGVSNLNACDMLGYFVYTLFMFLGYMGETLKNSLGDNGYNQGKKLGYILSGKLVQHAVGSAEC